MRPNFIYSRHYETDLNSFGINKPFALDRGTLVLEKLGRERGHAVAYSEPDAITLDDAALVHTQEYLGSLANADTWIKLMEFNEKEYAPTQGSRPLPDLLDDILIKCGGTYLACERAFESDLAVSLGGGYHHAFPDQGRGFCALNDIAIAIKMLQKRKLAEFVLIVDLDFHQGDGTALIFRNDPSVFTLSVHSEEGWPEEKQLSSIDVPIKTGDEDSYLPLTKKAIQEAIKRFSPDLVIFVAGSDPYEKDILPGTRFLNLSLETMRERDEFVIDFFTHRGIPLAMVFAGGYGPDVWEVHYNAVRHLLAQSRQGLSFASVTS
jgi:acetoin utilization deacetylase AcuC-like enzyme